MQKPWIQTYNGHQIDLTNPKVEDIDHIDIAHATSLLNRFTGHTTVGFSVAQHQVVGSIMAEVFYPTVKWLPQQFLFHDSPEAYVGDVSSPLKSLLPEYRSIENKFRTVIEMKFALSLEGIWIKTVDLRMLATERNLFMPGNITRAWADEMSPFGWSDFKYAVGKKYSNEDVGNATEELWDMLWQPWEPEFAEQKFLERMEHLEI